MLNIDKEVARMRKMTVNELRAKFGEVFKEPTTNRNKVWLIKRIAWRMQANEEGDLSERARKRALEIANDADIRMMPPRPKKVKDQRTITISKGTNKDGLTVGTKLQRAYRGQNVSVEVLENGFAYEGETYKSLSAVAKAITGTHWNGHLFFGFRKGGDK
jgi:hypothetical protein